MTGQAELVQHDRGGSRHTKYFTGIQPRRKMNFTEKQHHMKMTTGR